VTYRFSAFSVDPDRQELTEDGAPVAVQPQVFSLLVFLIEKRDRVVAKNEVIDAVWGGRAVSDSTLNARINALRRALGDSGETQAVIRTVPRRGFRFVAEVTQDRSSPDVQPKSMAASVRPTIAVLPFTNLSGDPEQNYFANGMAADLTIDLAKHPGLKLLSRNTAFALGENVEGLANISRTGVSHLVEGSVRKMGNKIRVSVELTGALDGGTLWAERYDGEISDIFEFQDSIRTRIVAALRSNLTDENALQTAERGTINTEAYDLYLKGRERYFHYTPEGLKDAIEFLKTAITLDPNFADAHAYLAYFYTAVRNLRFIEMKDPLGLAEESALRAVALAPESALANTWLGWVYGLGGDHEKAYELFEKAIALGPDLPEVFTYYGSICIYGGRPEKALTLSERAIELHSFAPPSWDFHVGQAHHLLKNYDKAIQKYEQARERIPKFTSLRLHMAAAYWEAGRHDLARKEIQAVLSVVPDYRLSLAATNYPYIQGEIRDRFIDALRSAGLKD
jgi:TolB-like protein/Tfp pilus assembly protein PilF